MESLPQKLPDSVKVGQEYIIEVVGEDIIEKQLYFVCLLCRESPENEKFAELEAHLASKEHQWKFLVSFEAFE